MRKNLCKRVTGLLAGLLLVLSLAGCGNDGDSKKLTAKDDKETTEATTEAVTETSTQENTTQDNMTQDNKSDIDYEEVYAPVFDELSGLILNGYDYDKVYDYVSSGIIESSMYREKDELLGVIKYVITDISGDGIPELLIGEDMSTGENAADESSYIYCGFTYKDGEIVSFLEGWARSSYQWMGNGSFFYMGSSSAFSTMFGKNHISPDGTELIWDDLYFSDQTADGNIGYYHNTEGIYDISASDVLNISDEDFWKLIDNYKTETLDWEPIGNLIGEGAGGNANDNSDSNKADMEKIVGTWLFSNGASLNFDSEGYWMLYDDEENWLFSGDWTVKRDGDKISIILNSELGDAGSGKIAEGVFYKDATGYNVIDIKFSPGLTDFTDNATLSRAL